MGAPSWPAGDLAYLCANYHILGPKRIAAELGRSHTAVRTMGNRLGLKSAFQLGVESVRHDYFAEVNKPVQAYLLGLMASDGCVTDDGRIQLELVDKDRALVELLRDQIAPAVRITERTTRTSDRACCCVVSARMARDLAAYGVTPRKTFTLRWPESLAPGLEGSYICGAFDGDGTMGLIRDSRSGRLYPRWELISASQGFLESVAASIRRNTDAAVVGPYLPEGRSTWQIRANSANAITVDHWIHADVPGLDRKRVPAEIVARTWRRSPRRPEDIPPLPGRARGSRNSKAKLTEASVAEVRARHRSGETIRSMAVEYGVSRVALRNAISGKTWAHVTDESPVHKSG